MTMIKVYNGEYFEKGKLRYVIFILINISLITGLILFGNYFGAILIILIVGGYLTLHSTQLEEISISFDKDFLYIGDSKYPRKDVNGFYLEIKEDSKGHSIRNIIFVIKGNNYIYTVNDELENIRNFVVLLSDKSTLLNHINLTTLEKTIRKFKL